MATEKRLIDANALKKEIVDFKLNLHPQNQDYGTGYFSALSVVEGLLAYAPTVDAVPVDKIKLHHIIIDNEGVPEVKLQVGDRYFLLRTDPVDVREVVNGRWLQSEPGYRVCSHCMADVAIYSNHKNYCPNCGAKMDGDGNG